MKSNIIPWPCLIDYEEPTNNPPKISSEPSNPITRTLNSSQPRTIKKSTETPWKKLQGDTSKPDSNKSSPITALKHPKTFAKAVSNRCDIPSSQLPQPVLKGDNLAIEIPEEEYVAGMETCKHNLHARII